ncbi:hypothetical protein P3T36_005590 [Kitasatospora sp. MAP12-15]|uniref:hypothetical protein n=1 Tax=unclassified Kitasatospora TaxID=2633591 RepID=UPI0024762FA6|nr:hypothetical protein [Kitasatospora sp. MAP12-44]MDH6113111.1 hypothetical protein [Kitasatospora sp. MAP12-44]
MRVLAYEGRRLLGLRSTWLILAAVLLAQATVAAVASRQAAPGPLPVAAGIRLITAAVPLLPIPLAALAAGALGALAFGHEVRHPGLAASQVRYLSRLRLIAAKLAVNALVAAALATLSLLVDTVVVRFALPHATSAARLYTPALLRADQRPLLVLVTFVALVVVAGWTGVLAAALTRSAVAGLLLLCALPTLIEPVAGALVERAGAGWAIRAEEALPFQHGLDQLYGSGAGLRPALSAPGALTSPIELFGLSGLSGTVEPLAVLALLALLAPVTLLVLGCLFSQARRRSL